MSRFPWNFWQELAGAVAANGFNPVPVLNRHRRADLDACVSDNVRKSTSADTSPSSPSVARPTAKGAA